MTRVRWWPFRQESDTESGRAATTTVVATTGVRLLAASVVLVPSAVLLVRLGEPFAMSAMASTAAIVLHSPNRYRRRPAVIAICYAVGLALTVPISLTAVFTPMSGLVASTIAAVLIVASPLGRVHPPTACIPLAITTAPSAGVLLNGWLAFAAVAAAVLVGLWLLTFTLRRI
ncbi:Uncharacterised protein [Mycolicibacterium vanbaalenii]|uniref:HPP family protein n=1 Tax=Mycolicibacterium vanbaalenii TaxID=110539 RepID=A0A5S9R7Y1_MYCVN|nr:hypothetical protein [Mycolicibacterium vanbaalenii]CAA0132152.1 Uncharacterised protein [Mycolicibacterium vanbaalenii]